MIFWNTSQSALDWPLTNNFVGASFQCPSSLLPAMFMNTLRSPGPRSNPLVAPQVTVLYCGEPNYSCLFFSFLNFSILKHLLIDHCHLCCEYLVFVRAVDSWQWQWLIATFWTIQRDSISSNVFLLLTSSENCVICEAVWYMTALCKSHAVCCAFLTHIFFFLNYYSF